MPHYIVKSGNLFPAAILLLTLLGGPVPALKASEPTNQMRRPEPVAVSVAKASESAIPALIELAGTVQAVDRAAIAAKVTGVITKVPVVLGSQVKAGDLLISISAEEIAAKLSQAETQLAQAKRNLEREQSLLAKNAATADTVKSMADAYAIAQAGHREAKTMLGYATITAPFDGVITRKLVSSGDLATPGTVLLQLENPRKLQVSTAVPENLILTLKTGDTLTVTVPTAGATVQGIISEIAPAADPSSRTAPITIELPGDPHLRSGQFARVIIPSKAGTALLIPSSAIVPLGQMDRVFVVANDRAHLRLIRIGRQLDGSTEVLTGLNPGETVVTTNNRLLVNGQALRIQP